MMANLEARTGYQPWRVPYHPLIIGMEGHLNNPPEKRALEWVENSEGEKVEAFYYYEPSSWEYGEWPRKWGETEFSRVDQDLVFPPPSGFSPGVKYNEVGNILEGDLYFRNDPGRLIPTCMWALSAMDVISILVLLMEMRRDAGKRC